MNRVNKPNNRTVTDADKRLTLKVIATLGAAGVLTYAGDQLGKLARPLKIGEGITSIAATEYDTKVFPNRPPYNDWTREQQIAYKRNVVRDRWQFGKNGWNKRKWWYESVYDLSLRPQKYNLSCEFNCLHKLLKINNVNQFSSGEKITEDELINATSINVNPNLGRPANINGENGKIPPDNYGIYAKALAGAISPKISGATLHGFDYTDFNPNNGTIQNQYKDLFLSLASKGRFIFWFQQDLSHGSSNYYDAELGKSVQVAPTEHCGICLAVDSENKQIMYADPINNGIYYMDIEGENGLIARAQNVGFNMLSLEQN